MEKINSETQKEEIESQEHPHGSYSYDWHELKTIISLMFVGSFGAFWVIAIIILLSSRNESLVKPINATTEVTTNTSDINDSHWFSLHIDIG